MSTEPVWPAGYGRRLLDEVTSTLDEAVRIAPGLTRPEWILARRQTRPRGRRGRAWSAPEGNLSATLVLPGGGAPSQGALRSFVAALALFDACAGVTGRTAGLELKWPNDVLLNGGKLAGILLESAGQGGRLSHLAIGIGVNLAHAPREESLEEGALPAVTLASATGALVDPEVFLTYLAEGFEKFDAEFRAHGFLPIREAWLEKAAKLGHEITARTATSETTGIFETVDDTGQLVLWTDQGRVAIPAADVYF